MKRVTRTSVIPLAAVMLLLAAGARLAVAAETPLDDDPRNRGIQHFEAGRLAEAEAAFLAALDNDQNDSISHAYLGRIALQLDDPDKAIERLEAAVELNEDDSMAHTWLASAYLAKLRSLPFMEQAKYTHKILDQLKTAIELDGDNLEARTILANYYVEAPAIGGGDLNKAREQIAIIKEKDPGLGAKLEAQLLPHDEK